MPASRLSKQGLLDWLNQQLGRTSGQVLSWAPAGGTSGEISGTGRITLTGNSPHVTVQSASTNQNRARISANTTSTLLDLDHYAGSSLWFAHRIDTSGQSLRLRLGTEPTALGAATFASVLEFGAPNSVGFFGVTPKGPTARTLPAAGVVTADDLRAFLITIGLAQ